MQQLLHPGPQDRVPGELGRLGPPLPLPGQPVRPFGLVLAGPRTGVAGQLAADRRGGAAHPPPDLAHRQARLPQPGHLIPLLTVQVAVTVCRSRGPVHPAHDVMQPVRRALRHAGRGPGLIRAHPSGHQVLQRPHPLRRPGRRRRLIRRPGGRRRPLDRQPGHPAHLQVQPVRGVPRHPGRPGRLHRVQPRLQETQHRLHTLRRQLSSSHSTHPPRSGRCDNPLSAGGL